MLFTLSYVQEWSEDIVYTRHSFIFILDSVGTTPVTLKSKNIMRLFGNGSFTTKATAPSPSGNPWREIFYSSNSTAHTSLFYQIHDRHPKEQMVVFGSESFVNDIVIEEGLPVQFFKSNNFKELTESVITFLKTSKPMLVVVELHAPHAFTSSESTDYVDYVKSIDKCVGKLLDAIYECKVMNESHIMLFSNHGVDSNEIIWACQGPFVPAKAEIIVPVTLYDTAVSSGYALDLFFPSLWNGKVPYLGDGTQPANRMVRRIIRGILLVISVIIIMIIVFSLSSKINDEHVALQNNPAIPHSLSFSVGSWISSQV